ncbi:hypothetical protein J437_LFUL019504 [Ladona fulva]|uniref:Uncharacterized protein n=1 Tax=Ladona fulva TaxID=123851 RepID=A0A8K0PB99_LADFU|nr:hypothetical protein J437_LFUL019504 [Ladona fulva]
MFYLLCIDYFVLKLQLKPLTPVKSMMLTLNLVQKLQPMNHANSKERAMQTLYLTLLQAKLQIR